MTILDKVRDTFIDDEIGTVYKRQEIIYKVNTKHGINLSSIIPSDYCYNLMNNDKLKNKSLFDFNIFEYTNEKSYKYIGEKSLYNGDIIQRPNGKYSSEIVGKWIKGQRIIFK